MLILFKFLLILSVIGVSYLFIFRVQHLLAQRLLGTALAGTLAVFIAVPDLSTIVARWFGIGRGTDFILYLANVLWAYMVVMLYLRLIKLQKDIRLMAQSIALDKAIPPGAPPLERPRDSNS